MENNLEQKIRNVIKKPRFWMWVIALVLFSMLFDLFFGTFLVVKSITSGRWDMYLLLLGLVYVVNNIYAYKFGNNKELKRLSKLLWLICFAFAWKLNGFAAALYFNFIILFSARILRMIVPRLLRNFYRPIPRFSS